MKEVDRRIPFLLLILVLLVAPVANAWCGTVCLAASISSGCAHGLQPTDDLPADKAADRMVTVERLDFVAPVMRERTPDAPATSPVLAVPLRL